MLIMRRPQFETQDDFGTGSGIPPIPEWQIDPLITNADMWCVHEGRCDINIKNVLMRLRSIFHQKKHMPLEPSCLHDLTCFVVHRLLSTAPNPQATLSKPYSECIRYAMSSYMFIVQGPTYYSHALLLQDLMGRYINCLEQTESRSRFFDELDVWLHAIGLVGTSGTTDYEWFASRTGIISSRLALSTWDDVFFHIKKVLWLDLLHVEAIFRSHWEPAFGLTKKR